MSDAATPSNSLAPLTAHPARLPLWIWAIGIAILAGYAAVSLLVGRGSTLTAFGDVVQCIVPLLAVTTLLWNASSSEWRKNLFWTMLAAGCALWMFGQLMWTYFEVGLHRPVPNPFIGDVIFFLHIVPMFVAVAMAPHAGKSDLKQRLSYLDFSSLLVWWVYLYLFIVIPWQYVARNDTLYGTSFNELYGIENFVLVIAFGALVIQAQGAWKKIYLHLLGAALLYALSSDIINAAIDKGRYQTGSIYDVPLLASFLWFASAGLIARRLKPESDPEATTAGQSFTGKLSMAAVLSMPPMALWCVWGSSAPDPVKTFRFGVTQVAILIGVLLISKRRGMIDHDRLRLVSSLQDSVDRMQRLQSRLVQSEKLASLGHLAAGAAHEINNPLTGILGYTDLLASESSLSDNSRSLIEKIREQGLRIKKLVTSLLSFSRQVPAEKTPLDIVQIVNSSLQLGGLSAHRKNVKIEVKADPMLPTVRGDSDQLLRVFFNLIDNAADAMQEIGGGTLTIKIFSERGKVIADFSDTGPGIKDPRQVFDPFYTTKPAGKGTGLGLSLCYGIMQEHGGDLTCYNRREGGATFRVELPIPLMLGGPGNLQATQTAKTHSR
jgi:signal transduction histidine kinase